MTRFSLAENILATYGEKGFQSFLHSMKPRCDIRADNHANEACERLVAFLDSDVGRNFWLALKLSNWELEIAPYHFQLTSEGLSNRMYDRVEGAIKYHWSANGSLWMILGHYEASPEAILEIEKAVMSKVRETVLELL